MIRADAHYTISTHQTLDKTPYAEHSEALMCREKWNGKGQVRDAPSLCDVTTLPRPVWFSWSPGLVLMVAGHACLSPV
jgi:hypothetical protein